MKILAIRGKNLASLAGEFEVDFTSEPLRSAGVFAITGQTGAGKSTLLDALSLALFHNTPRLNRATERGVNVPDVENESISQNDPRHILRRGTGNGYAEVDFIGVDKKAWRARWDVRRARQKADGKLQQAEVSLIAIDSGQQEGRGKNEVSQAIKLRLGLSFDQFRRAVLLAQNEFAEFLSARSDERADLLEALTGTEIYARISQMCFERYREETKTLETIKEKLAVEPPLSTEQRIELEAAATRAREQAAQAETELKTVSDERQWHLQGEKLRILHSETTTELKKLQADRLEREPDAQLIAQHELAEQARPKREQLKTAEQDLAAHQEKQAILSNAVDQSKTALSKTAEQARLAEKQAEQASKIREQQAPAIKQARALDEAIRQSKREQRELEEKAETQHQELIQAKESEHHIEEQLSACKRQMEAWQSWLDGHPLLATMSADWPELGRLLVHAGTCFDNQQQANITAQRASEAAETIRSEIKAKQDTIKVQTAQRDLASQAREKARQSLKAFDIKAIERERDALPQRRALLDQLAEKLQQLSASISRLLEQEKHQASLKAIAKEIQQRLEKLNKRELPAAFEEYQLADAAYQRASLITEQHTEKLRTQLADGEPCPVCGATDHPGHPEGESGLRELVRTLEAQRQEARAVHDSLEKELAQLNADASSNATANKLATDELKQRTDERQRLAERVNHIADSLGISATTADDITAALAELRETHEQQENALQDTRTQLDAKQQTNQLAESAFNTEQTKLEQYQAELDGLNQQAAPRLDAANAAKTRLELREKELSDAISDLQAALGTDATPEHSQVKNWLGQQRDGEGHRQVANKATEKLPLLQSNLDRQASQIKKFQQAREVISKAQQQQQDALKNLTSKRLKTLQAEDVEAYAVQLDEAEKHAASALKRASDAVGCCRLDAQKAEQALKHWKQRLAELETQRVQTLHALERWFAEHHRALELPVEDLGALLNLLDQPGEQWQAMREEIKALETTISEKTTASKTIAGQVAAWEKEAGSKRNFDAVEQALAIAKQQAEECRNATAQQAAALHQDDERIQRIAGHRKALDDQSEIQHNWASLNDLIGAADGKKFKNYAQQFTLDVLIAYANQQLTNLAPRYRLKRSEDGLGILVVDQDMGGEVRGIHSLSGGETFLASLGLALGLAALSSQRISIESLFIDEGFGSLDADTLRVAMDALDRLQSQGRKVGVISHVQEMSERIGVQIQVQRSAGGRSALRVSG